MMLFAVLKYIFYVCLFSTGILTLFFCFKQKCRHCKVIFYIYLIAFFIEVYFSLATVHGFVGCDALCSWVSLIGNGIVYITVAIYSAQLYFINKPWKSTFLTCILATLSLFGICCIAAHQSKIKSTFDEPDVISVSSVVSPVVSCQWHIDILTLVFEICFVYLPSFLTISLLQTKGNKDNVSMKLPLSCDYKNNTVCSDFLGALSFITCVNGCLLLLVRPLVWTYLIYYDDHFKSSFLLSGSNVDFIPVLAVDVLYSGICARSILSYFNHSHSQRIKRKLLSDITAMDDAMKDKITLCEDDHKVNKLQVEII